MPRANLSRLSLLVVLAALTGTASGPGKSTAWWTAVPEIVLFEEDFRNPELPGWRRESSRRSARPTCACPAMDGATESFCA